MILYLDTSSLVKLYAEESGSPEIRMLVESAFTVATSRAAYVEARAAFSRKRRENGLEDIIYRQMVDDLNQDWGYYFIIEISGPVVTLAGGLTEKYPLRAYDAIHLASAIRLKDEGNVEVTFSSFDQRLLQAAKVEKLIIPAFHNSNKVSTESH